MPSARIAQILLTVMAALALAAIAAHPRVRAFERRLGLTVLISTGLPFLGLGFVMGHPGVGVLDRTVLEHLRPIFEFGLGWIGFVVGMQFDVHKLDRMPRSLGSVIAIQSLVPMVTTAILCGWVFIELGLLSQPRDMLRDILVLTACAASSAPLSLNVAAQSYGRPASLLIDEITRLDEIAALSVLGLVAVFFRPDAAFTRWVLPASAWLLVSLGLGTVLGIVTYMLIRGADSEAEELSLLLGAVAFAAGLAGYLALSAPVICAIAGALLANLPMGDRRGFTKILLDVERPIYLIFLMFVGASWRPLEWQGWVLGAAFALARVTGKILGAVWAKRLGPSQLPPPRWLALALMPQSPIAIVVMVSAATLHPGEPPPVVRWCINAMIIGSVLTEIGVRFARRLDRRRRPIEEIERLVIPGDA
jgi:hypothetical protein